MSKIAFFDFDGTLTYKDTMLDFIRFMVGTKRFILGIFRCAPMLLAFKLGFVSNNRAKEYFLTHFLEGVDEQYFKESAKRYSLSQIDSLLRPKAIERIKWHKEQGDYIVIVSASMKSWLAPWCSREGVALISTALEFSKGKCTGKLETPNCYGEEKVKRILHEYDLNNYTETYAYGDTSGDKPMLSLVDHAYYRHF